jgi:hypothetical protein
MFQYHAQAQSTETCTGRAAKNRPCIHSRLIEAGFWCYELAKVFALAAAIFTSSSCKRLLHHTSEDSSLQENRDSEQESGKNGPSTGVRKMSKS